ncbi:hypothetical protein D9M72_551590 [compost metagenome]
MVRVSVSLGSSQRSGSGIGTWNTMVWPARSGVSGMRWRVWMMDASAVRSVVCTPVTRPKKRRILMALVVSSEPWSITLSTSGLPMMAAVTWMPPVPQP